MVVIEWKKTAAPAMGRDVGGAAVDQLRVTLREE